MNWPQLSFSIMAIIIPSGLAWWNGSMWWLFITFVALFIQTAFCVLQMTGGAPPPGRTESDLDIIQRELASIGSTADECHENILDGLANCEPFASGGLVCESTIKHIMPTPVDELFTPLKFAQQFAEREEQLFLEQFMVDKRPKSVVVMPRRGGREIQEQMAGFNIPLYNTIHINKSVPVTDPGITERMVKKMCVLHAGFWYVWPGETKSRFVCDHHAQKIMELAHMCRTPLRMVALDVAAYDEQNKSRPWCMFTTSKARELATTVPKVAPPTKKQS